MFHKQPAGKSVGARRKVRRLKQTVDGRRRGERGGMSNTWTKIKEKERAALCMKNQARLGCDCFLFQFQLIKH